MDHKFWLERWKKADIGFHQESAHDCLVRHWPALGVSKSAQVFVPLCGKSLDMVWLADHGHAVIGTELAEAAVDQFFAERSRTPASVTQGSFVIKRAGLFELWCGDHLQLAPAVTRHIRGVFDRAALVAMPRVMQQAYADQLAALTPASVPVLLVALDYDPSQMDGPPFPITPQRIEELFGANFRITLLERRDGLSINRNLQKRGLSWLDEATYKLVRR